MLEISPSGRDDKKGSFSWGSETCPNATLVGMRALERRAAFIPTWSVGTIVIVYPLPAATDGRPVGLRLVSLRGIRARWGPLALSRAARRGTG